MVISLQHWRSRLCVLSPLATDVLLTLVVSGLSLIGPFGPAYQSHAVPSGPVEGLHTSPSGLAVALTLFTALPLVARRRAPIAVMTVIEGAEAALLAILWLPSPVAGLGLAIALYTVATRTSRRTSLGMALAVALINALVLIAGLVLGRAEAGPLLIAMTILALGSWSLGENTRTRRAYLAELEDRARRLEIEREENAHRAVQEERTRIARELHDVAAHHVSAIAVQAAAAEAILERDPERAREALQWIQDMSRESLGEMRTLLNVLRSGDGLDAARTPQPTLAQIDRLVNQSQATGLPITLTIEGNTRPLPAALDLSAYRIVQEALTNSLKHAGPAHACVRVRYGRDMLELEVRDDGKGSSDTRGMQGSGRGLIGMRERVALFGGELVVGPAQEGGFVVRARLDVLGA